MFELIDNVPPKRGNQGRRLLAVAVVMPCSTWCQFNVEGVEIHLPNTACAGTEEHQRPAHRTATWVECPPRVWVPAPPADPPLSCDGKTRAHC